MKGETKEFDIDFMVGKTFDKIYLSENRSETYYITEFFNMDGSPVHTRADDNYYNDNHLIYQNLDNLPKYDYCHRVASTSFYNQCVIFKNDGETVFFSHDQECCECVKFESIDIPFEQLQGHKILSAKCRTVLKEDKDGYGDERSTWYIFEVEGVGTATMRWSGESNGWYSTMVDVYYQDDRIYNDWCKNIN
jgi:hypothetical protein